MTSLRINEHAVRRLKLGYPWIFRSELVAARETVDLTAGQVVDFIREKGEFVARGFFNPQPQLVGRVLTHDSNVQINAAFVKARVASALAMRDKLYAQPYYRLIHAESDGLPGLIVDRYGDVLVCQVNTAGMSVLWPHLEAALQALVKPSAIVLRNDTAAREAEGLAEEKRVIGALPKDGVTIVENETRFHVDVLEGQKTGWFFDQRENRAWVAQLSKGAPMIDVFCHTGGFGVTALRHGAESATFVDSSAPALAMVKKNAELNGASAKCKTVEGKAFDVMEKMAGEKRTFPVVSVDPPAFIKTRKDLASGMRGYMKLAKLSEPLVAKGGYLYFASCSSHADVNELADAVTEGMSKSGRPFQLIKVTGAAPDHPVQPLLPETSYLKGLTFRFMD